MVLTKPHKFEDVYKMIKEDALLGLATTVLILVSPSCDSLCAVKIITTILQSDMIPYQILPINGKEDLDEVDEKSVKDKEDLRTIIMINCGGGVDILNTFTLQESVMVYIIDSHRPYFIGNIQDESHVVILDDGEDYDLLQVLMEENQDDDESELDESDDVGKKSKKRKRREAEAYSERPHYFGTSASSMIYELATRIKKETLDDILWCAIVGMTDQFVHERTTFSKYLEEVENFRRLVLSSNISQDEGPSDKTTRRLGDKLESRDRIEPKEEYRFMLYRHWNLYDAMYHSRYIACKLGIWKRNGQKRLDVLLARMGIPKEQSKQIYSAMREDLKDSLRSKIETYGGKELGLEEICYQSFRKYHGYTLQISAADMVYGITALLEHGNGVDDPLQSENTWASNFWSGYDALSKDKAKNLEIGLKLAIRLQEAIVRLGTSILEKKITILSGPFRYCVLNESQDSHFFIHPLALTKLALFMIETLHAMGKVHKPFIICALNEKINTYLVVGVSNSSSITIKSSGLASSSGTVSGDTKKAGDFTRNFKKAANATGAHVKYHSFDGGVVEILRDDLTKFIEYLHSGLVL